MIYALSTSEFVLSYHRRGTNVLQHSKCKQYYSRVIIYKLGSDHMRQAGFKALQHGMKIELVSQFLDFNVPSTAQGHLRTNHTFKSILHQCNTQVTKSQICLIHGYNVTDQPSVYLSMQNNTCLGTYLNSLGIHHGKELDLFTPKFLSVVSECLQDITRYQNMCYLWGGPA